MTEFDYDKIKDVILAANKAAEEHREKVAPKNGKASSFMSALLGGMLSGSAVFLGVHAFWVRANDHLEIDYPALVTECKQTQLNARTLEKRVTRLEWVVSPEVVRNR